ncbi:MAG: hypothetical protein OIF32_10210 [Campylobacterales bacterium]|nr:hypothetical protein [Campylobacterales bacterium]
MNSVAIAYRIYPKVSKVPAVHQDDKIKLSELCLSSFRKSLTNLNFKVFAILDGCPKEYEELFQKYFNEDELEIINVDSIGNRETFRLQMKILEEQTFSENIYFAEDDYFYLPDTFYKLVEFLQEDDVDFVTPYDHLDNYTLPLHDYKNEIKICAGEHWRSVATTTMTFLTTKKVLKQSKHVFNTYTKRNLDASLWLCATKEVILCPSNLIKLGLFGEYGKIFKKAYLDGFGWMQIFFGKRYKLFSPMKSLATHMEKDFLAPNIDWYKEFEKHAEEK